MNLRGLIELFLDGNDDKIYIDVFNGDDCDEIFHDIRIISSDLVPYYDREVIALMDGSHSLLADTTLGVILRKGDVKNDR